MDVKPDFNDIRFDDIQALEKFVKPIMKAIATAIGPHCEVVLHDLTDRDMDHSIRCIENGHVSGRSVGGPSTILGFEALREEAEDHNEYGYRGETADGRPLNCSSIYFRNQAGSIIGALCINLDLSPLQSAADLIGSFLPAPAAEHDVREVVGGGLDSVLETMVADAVKSVGVPALLMRKADRMEVVRILDENGAFGIKRSVDRVAKMLGVSRVTCYSYLDQVRKPEQTAQH